MLYNKERLIALMDKFDLAGDRRGDAGEYLLSRAATLRGARTVTATAARRSMSSIRAIRQQKPALLIPGGDRRLCVARCRLG